MSLAVAVVFVSAGPFRWTAAATAAETAVREINLVHFSHTDVGFTDSPAVCRELYRRYLDIAVDAIADSMQRPADERFVWTAEATLPCSEWSNAWVRTLPNIPASGLIGGPTAARLRRARSLRAGPPNACSPLPNRLCGDR